MEENAKKFNRSVDHIDWHGAVIWSDGHDRQLRLRRALGLFTVHWRLRVAAGNPDRFFASFKLASVSSRVPWNQASCRKTIRIQRLARGTLEDVWCELIDSPKPRHFSLSCAASRSYRERLRRRFYERWRLVRSILRRGCNLHAATGSNPPRVGGNHRNGRYLSELRVARWSSSWE